MALCNDASIFRGKKSFPVRSGRITTIIAVAVPGVFLLIQDRSRSRAERDGARAREDSIVGYGKKRENQRCASRMHFQIVVPPTSCMPRLGRDAEILEPSRRASEARRSSHRVHTRRRSPRDMRDAARYANGLHAVITEIACDTMPRIR